MPFWSLSRLRLPWRKNKETLSDEETSEQARTSVDHTESLSAVNEYRSNESGEQANNIISAAFHSSNSSRLPACSESLSLWTASPAAKVPSISRSSSLRRSGDEYSRDILDLTCCVAPQKRRPKLVNMRRNTGVTSRWSSSHRDNVLARQRSERQAIWRTRRGHSVTETTFSKPIITVPEKGWWRDDCLTTRDVEDWIRSIPRSAPLTRYNLQVWSCILSSANTTPASSDDGIAGVDTTSPVGPYSDAVSERSVELIANEPPAYEWTVHASRLHNQLQMLSSAPDLSRSMYLRFPRGSPIPAHDRTSPAARGATPTTNQVSVRPPMQRASTSNSLDPVLDEIRELWQGHLSTLQHRGILSPPSAGRQSSRSLSRRESSNVLATSAFDERDLDSSGMPRVPGEELPGYSENPDGLVTYYGATGRAYGGDLVPSEAVHHTYDDSLETAFQYAMSRSESWTMDDYHIVVTYIEDVEIEEEWRDVIPVTVGGVAPRNRNDVGGSS